MKRFLPIALALVIVAGLAALIISLETKKSATPHMPPKSKNLLETADEFTLYSLDPDMDFLHQATNAFMGHAILGQIEIETGPKRNALVEALDEAIANGSDSANCFNPRHGIHVRKGTETLDCLICFECLEAEVGTNWYAISDDPKALFNQTIQDAGVPLPKN